VTTGGVTDWLVLLSKVEFDMTLLLIQIPRILPPVRLSAQLYEQDIVRTDGNCSLIDVLPPVRSLHCERKNRISKRVSYNSIKSEAILFCVYYISQSQNVKCQLIGDSFAKIIDVASDLLYSYLKRYRGPKFILTERMVPERTGTPFRKHFGAGTAFR